MTSVEPDHLETTAPSRSCGRLSAFLAEAPATVVCADEELALGLGAASAHDLRLPRRRSYRIVDFESARAAIRFSRSSPPAATSASSACRYPGHTTPATPPAALAVALGVGLPDDARRALARFAGVARRFQFRGEVGGVTFVDDYAHLPGEVIATLKAARSGGWRRIVCVFQPHRYSRTASLAADFADAFVDADLFVLTAVYGAGETPRPGVSAKLVLDAVLERPSRTRRRLPAHREELVTYLRESLHPGDCCLTLSAGDLTSLPDELVADLEEAGP